MPIAIPCHKTNHVLMFANHCEWWRKGSMDPKIEILVKQGLIVYIRESFSVAIVHIYMSDYRSYAINF